MARPAALIYNPAAGRQRAATLVTQLLKNLRRRGYETEPWPTAAPGDATALAQKAAAAGASTVFALGGDGTLREAAAGLLGSDVALGFLPAGTANVMAIALGLPTHATAVAQRADRLVPVTVDIGRCGQELFLMMASAGLDGAALHVVRPALKRRLGRIGVALAGLEAWWRYDYPAIEVAVGATRSEASLIVVSNSPFYGGAVRMAPDAAFDDGLLDVVLFRGSGRRATLSFAADLARCRHLSRPDTEHFQTDRLRLLAPAGFAAQIDGEPRHAQAPLDIHIEPAALRLLRLP